MIEQRLIHEVLVELVELPEPLEQSLPALTAQLQCYALLVFDGLSCGARGAACDDRRRLTHLARLVAPPLSPEVSHLSMVRAEWNVALVLQMKTHSHWPQFTVDRQSKQLNDGGVLVHPLLDTMTPCGLDVVPQQLPAGIAERESDAVVVLRNHALCAQRQVVEGQHLQGRLDDRWGRHAPIAVRLAVDRAASTAHSGELVVGGR
mmetsp:Transcript_3258/g.8225  ORF Transcript_3258/g.8225 Transcript_3258/m.8225 type:complete len:205 (-) Transcript_3258:1535-2149(-)